MEASVRTSFRAARECPQLSEPSSAKSLYTSGAVSAPAAPANASAARQAATLDHLRIAYLHGVDVSRDHRYQLRTGLFLDDDELRCKRDQRPERRSGNDDGQQH